MQISIKGYITSKESELFYDCADRYARNTDLHKFAISDGVSKSFFPKIWADVLVNNWVNKIWNTDEEFIEVCQKKWLEQVTEIVNKPDAKWFTKNAFNRKESGLATFVGLRFFKKKKDWYWKADALGDSFLFFVPSKIKDFSKECIVLSSKQEPIVFDNFPDCLSSLGNNHKGEKQLKENPLTAGTFYLMTDALAEWFLNERYDAISKIDVWQNQKDFERFVDEERYNKKLGNDDTAYLSIKLEDNRKDELTYVFDDVSHINELVIAQQNKIKERKIAKEKELIIQKENSNSEISAEQLQQPESGENIPTQEVETEIAMPKKGIIEKSRELLFGKKEKEHTAEKIEIENEEKVETTQEHQEEKESSIQEEENDIEIKKPIGIEKGESHESNTMSQKESEVEDTKPKNSPKNTIDKF